MAHPYQKKSIKTQIVSVFKESAGPDGVWRLHKYHICYFRLHFSNIGYWECPSKAQNAMLDYSIAKKWKWYCQYCLILWEKLKIMSKKPKCLWEITSRFLRGRERRKTVGHVGVLW